MDIKTVFRALRHRNYRLFFGGQSISLIGTWMQMIAVSWLVYRMTNSPFLLGVVGFSSQIATFLLAPLAGVIADRHHRHRLLLITQSLAMLQATVLYVLFGTHTIAVWHIILLSLFLGAVNAFDIPVRQSFTVDMLDDKEDLSNAIALNSSMVNTARLIGPCVGGVLIAAFGEGTCFLANALSYIAVLLSLVMMKLPPWERSGLAQGSVMLQLKEGFAYAFNFIPIRAILMLLSVVSMVAGGLTALMPVFARDIFHGGARALGLLMAASGMGALIGAIYLASRRHVLGLSRIITVAATLFGVGVLDFSRTPVLMIGSAVLLVSGFGMMVQMASSNIMLQTMVEEDKRGRVMSFYTMAFMGLAPFGSLFSGILAAKIGASSTLLYGGILSIIAAVVFAGYLPKIRSFVRPLYIQKGIIVETVQ
ncbi:MAG: MFS transporter [Candidatus Omnitrophica bacterium]|nr:MFS transporter [Candidatus Omnitrophota bacterium]MDE2213726.1 MFS transporter [Candidatus Omnitrophota bacterium]